MISPGGHANFCQVSRASTATAPAPAIAPPERGQIFHIKSLFAGYAKLVQSCSPVKTAHEALLHKLRHGARGSSICPNFYRGQKDTYLKNSDELVLIRHDGARVLLHGDAIDLE
ncbi:hypothetical protein FHG87_003731 [Trinorchestia longiramus]|nr:hypothetical protein FHG87_003731 [Trinorchestia longiramus]